MSQNYANHRKNIPVFHFFVLPFFVFYIGWSISHLVKNFSADTVVGVLLAIALLLSALYARMFALAVQDRVIRLEMQLRMASVLPADLRFRIPEFTVGQLVALRFASDAELPDLSRKVLQEKLEDRNAIKKMIRDWQPDTQRA
jgi:uncharacterized membrane protein YcfT